MTRLAHSFAFDIRPFPPYSFKLTMQKPAGWSLFTQFEIFKNDALWTALHVDGDLIGLKLSSKGTIERPHILAKVFLKEKPTEEELQTLKEALKGRLGADQDLKEFYSLAKRDNILKHVVDDLYGMHDTDSGDIFAGALLAILLQMAPMERSEHMMESIIKRYGDLAEFDGKRILTWPTSKRISGVTAKELAKECKVGYRAKRIVPLARFLESGKFPSIEELKNMSAEEAKEKLLELPGIGDYSADMINPHGGFPIDVWSVEIFGKLFYGKEPKNNRNAIEKVKKEGIKRWGEWSWMAFFYVVQDLKTLSERLGIELRLE